MPLWFTVWLLCSFLVAGTIAFARWWNRRHSKPSVVFICPIDRCSAYFACDNVGILEFVSRGHLENTHGLSVE
jgi:hypothetical protein